MAKKNESRTPGSNGRNEAEKLHGLNEETLNRRNASERIRRRLEATIEAKAKKRRSREVPESSKI